MLSVLLPYRDVVTTVGGALSSVLEDLEAGDEVIAIDDGSCDGSAEVVRRIADRRIVHLATRGLGIVGALGRGLAVARGELVARMDGDDVSLPGRFAASRALLATDPSLGVVAVAAEPFGDVGPGLARYVAWQNGVVTADEHARAIFVESPLCHPATTLRRAALEAVGGYRESAWAEDYDLWLRLHAAGFGLAKVPRVLFRWRIHAASLTWTDPRYDPHQHRAARAFYLAQWLEKRLRHETVHSFGIWGAGQTGKRLARALEAVGTRPAFFVDIDPKKVGGTARGQPIVSADVGIGRGFLVVAVGAQGARDIVRARLGGRGLVEGRDYLCAA